MNNFIPNVTYREQGGTHRSDVFSFLLSKRIILCTGEINIETSNNIIAQLLYLSNKDNKADINLYINSPGGHVQSGLAIFDMMNQIQADVKTICVGIAYSMGAMLLLLGTKGKRYALPHSNIMIHQPLMSFRDSTLKETDLTIVSEQLNKTKLELARLISERTNKSIEKSLEDMANDFYMNAEEAKAYGIIDHIGGYN